MGRASKPIEAWLDASWSRLFGYAVALTQDRERAGDLVQQAAVQALSSKHSPTDGANVRAWLFKIVRNLWIDQYRRRQASSEDPDASAEEAGDWTFDDRLLAEITVRQGLERIDPSFREIIELVDLYGFQYAEAAAILSVPPGTVMSRLSRARLALLNAIAGTNLTPLPVPEKRQRQ